MKLTQELAEKHIKTEKLLDFISFYMKMSEEKQRELCYMTEGLRFVAEKHTTLA